MTSPELTAEKQLNDSGSPPLPSDDAQQSSLEGQQGGTDKPISPSEPNGASVDTVIGTNPRLDALQKKKLRLEETLAQLQAQKSALVAKTTLDSGLSKPDSQSDEERTESAMLTANATIKNHIALLHRYNEIKDIAQGLMGLIAEQRGVRAATVMEGYGMDGKD